MIKRPPTHELPGNLFPQIRARLEIGERYRVWSGRFPWRWLPRRFRHRLFVRLQGEDLPPLSGEGS